MAIKQFKRYTSSKHRFSHRILDSLKNGTLRSVKARMKKSPMQAKLFRLQSALTCALG